MNKITIMGRLTRDPDVRYTQNSLAVIRFSVAVDRQKDKDGNKETDFFDCVAFGKKGEYIANYCSKGKRILVTGRMQFREYVNRENVKAKAAEILVDEAEVIDYEKKEEAPIGAAFGGRVVDESVPF